LRAARTARFTSSTSASATLAIVSPVLGSLVGKVFPDRTKVAKNYVFVA